MKIRGVCGIGKQKAEKNSNPNPLLEYLNPFLLQAKPMTNIGHEIGQFIGYDGILCEILDKKDDKFKLLAMGWVRMSDCSIEIEL